MPGFKNSVYTISFVGLQNLFLHCKFTALCIISEWHVVDQHGNGGLGGVWTVYQTYPVVIIQHRLNKKTLKPVEQWRCMRYEKREVPVYPVRFSTLFCVGIKFSIEWY